jgi:signal transduction histidine kinase
MLWRDAGGPEVEIVRISGGKATRSDVRRQTKWSTLPGSLLFNLPKNRVLMLGDAGRWRFLPAVGNLSDSFRKLIGVGEGLAVPIATGTIEGMAVFFEVRALSTDHLDVAPRVARELAVRIQDATLFAAVEERSMAKARVAVARDLHDSVVQFLAGLGFRLEALSRSPEAKGELAHGIADLKDTVMTEQRQLRAFIKGLRTGMPISMHDLTRDCSSLCKLLSRQWTIDCRCACGSETGFVPLRTQLDFQHLVREAVANAVRHGGAKHVTVAIHRDDDALNLTVTDDGRGFAPDKPAAPPASLNGRVREARGELKVESIEGRTSVIIRLPLERAE